MKTRLTALALVASLLLIMPLNIEAAAKDRSNGLGVPVSGTFTNAAGVGKFSGTLTITRFAVVNGGINAVGTVSGTLTDATGTVIASGLQTVSLPVTLSGGQASAAKPAGAKSEPGAARFARTSFDRSDGPEAHYVRAGGASAAPAQLSCEILRLSIGAINLDLLGLTVSLNPVLLVITAVPGAGNLLGNLLCAIVGLLDGVGTLIQIVNLLNQLLALLATL
jgi:hypothetical protein